MWHNSSSAIGAPSRAEQSGSRGTEDAPARSGEKAFMSSSNGIKQTYDAMGAPTYSGLMVDSAEKWKDFLGTPRVPMYYDPQDGQYRTNLDLPDAYKGSNVYIQGVVMRQIPISDQFAIRMFLPLILQNGGSTVSWSRVNFPDNLLSRVPEESVPRLLQHNISSGSEEMYRLALALRMEHGFMNTEYGRFMYRMHLKQIVNATVEYMCFSAMWAGFHHPAYVNPNADSRPKTGLSAHDIMARFRPEIEQWAIVQKNPENGANIVANNCMQEMRNRPHKLTGDAFVVPAGMGLAMRNNSAMNYYFVTGHRSGEKRDPLKEQMGQSVYESRGFRVSPSSPDVDPSVSTQSIGNRMMFDDTFLLSTPAAEYRTEMRDLVVYDQGEEDCVRLSYRVAVNNTGLFDKHGKLSDEVGSTYFAPYRSHGDYIRQAGGMRYFLDTLASKDEDVQKRFISEVLRHDSGATSTAPRQKQSEGSNSYYMAQGKTAGIFRRIKEADLAACFADPDGNEVKQVYDFLSHIDAEAGTSILETYIASLKKTPHVARGVMLDAWSTLGKEVLKADATVADKSLKGDDDIIRLAFEDASPRDRVRLDNEAPVWLPYGKDSAMSSTLRVFTAPGYDPNFGTILRYNTDAIHLTSARLVLFAIERPALDWLKRHAGAVYITIPEGPLKSDPIRSALLQYSVALSAVHALLVDFSKNGGIDTDPAAFKTLAADVLSVVNRKFTASMSESVMRQIHVKAQAFPVLYSQSFATGSLHAVQSILGMVYNPPKAATEAALFSLIRRAIECVQREVQSPNMAQPGTSAKLAANARRSPYFYEKQGYKDEQIAAAQASAKRILHEFSAPGRKTSKTAAAAAHSQATLEGLATYGFMYENLLSWLYLISDADNPNVDADARRLVQLVDVVYQGVARATVPENADALPLHAVMDAFIKQSNAVRSNVFRIFFDLVHGAAIHMADAAEKTDAFVKNPETLKREVQRVYSSSQERYDLLITMLETAPKIKTAREDVNPDALDAYETLLSVFYEKSTEESASHRLTPETIRDIIPVASQSVAEKLYAYASNRAEGTPTVADAYRFFKDPHEKQGISAILRSVNEQARQGAVIPASGIETLVDNLSIENDTFLKFCLDNHIYYPLGVLVLRPHMRYRMGSMIYFRKGEAGNVYYGHANAEMADNAAQKMHLLHWSIYARGIITDDSKLVIRRNVFCVDYLGGAGKDFYNPLNPFEYREYQRGVLNKSNFAAPVRANWRPEAKFTDITGSLNRSLGASPATSDMASYESADIMTNHWRWVHDSSIGMGSQESRQTYSTLCFQGSQWAWNNGSKKFDVYTKNAGHWGEESAGSGPQAGSSMLTRAALRLSV
jgi:hypothetical protein